MGLPTKTEMTDRVHPSVHPMQSSGPAPMIDGVLSEGELPAGDDAVLSTRDGCEICIRVS